MKRVVAFYAALLLLGIAALWCSTGAQAETLYASGKLDDAYVRENAQHAALTMSTATTTEVIAAPGAGKSIYIISIFVQSEGTCDVTLKSASTALTGVISFTNGDTLTRGPYRCGANEAFNLTTGHAVQLNGDVIYVVR